MKIEKLNKENIKEFIKDMAISDAEYLENNINKLEYFGIKEDDTFYLGFKSLDSTDSIAIKYYGSKLTIDKFNTCIDFLNKILVVNNHLIIIVYDKKYMKVLEEKYKCKEILATLGENSPIDNTSLKEKYADIGLHAIKYFFNKDIITCNLVKQNIQDNDVIIKLHEYFKSLGIKKVNFIVRSDNFDILSSLGYKCIYKSYVINNI